ncbi:hypothetical protein FRC03_001902 [Tulasnella sp. 419]|nr:hypothetical protein FRC03_001902 [Tulasnella sp. 419]
MRESGTSEAFSTTIELAALGNRTTPTNDVKPVQVTFTETAHTQNGQKVFIVGSIPQLGNWDPAKALALTRTNKNTKWEIGVSLPSNTRIEYKFIKKSGNHVSWESGENRVYTTSNKSGQTVAASWK